MKIFASICLLSLIVTGCSTDAVIPDSATETLSGAYAAKKRLQIPANPANGKDYMGLIYERILDAYYTLPANSRSLQQVITTGEQLAFADPEFLMLAGVPSYQSPTVSELQNYFAIDEQNIGNYLSDSYSVAAKETFSEITMELSKLKANEAVYDEVYAYLVALDERVLANTAISDEESSAVLITTSLLRYGLYHDKKRKRRDRDWDWMTGNIAATANAALESEAEAMIICFATDVY